MNIQLMDKNELGPRSIVIKAIGVGGCGSSTIDYMIECGLEGVEFIAVNTDLQALNLSKAGIKLAIGSKVTFGLGAGGNPELGEKAASEDRDMIVEALKGADMVFVAAGMGGGTGTGAAPIISQMARESGVLTVAVVTKPFEFEGSNKMRLAEEGIARIRGAADSLVIIQNQQLFSIIDKNDKKTPIKEAFGIANEILRQGIQSVSDLILKPGLTNMDFADIKNTMYEQKDALLGVGTASGDNRVEEAVLCAIENPLFEAAAIAGARRILVNVSGDETLALSEIADAVNLIRKKADPDAQIKHGSVVVPELGDKIKITVIATGFCVNAIQMDVLGAAPVSSVQSRDVIRTDQWNAITNSAAKIKNEGLNPRNYPNGDIETPTALRMAAGDADANFILKAE